MTLNKFLSFALVLSFSLSAFAGDRQLAEQERMRLQKVQLQVAIKLKDLSVMDKELDEVQAQLLEIQSNALSDKHVAIGSAAFSALSVGGAALAMYTLGRLETAGPGVGLVQGLVGLTGLGLSFVGVGTGAYYGYRYYWVDADAIDGFNARITQVRDKIQVQKQTLDQALLQFKTLSEKACIQEGRDEKSCHAIVELETQDLLRCPTCVLDDSRE